LAKQKLNIPQQIADMLKTIEREKCKAYIVGSCVSELLAGRTPMDYDIITNAGFEEMMYIFRDMRIVSRDRKMSSVMVSVPGMVVQVSSYKKEVVNGEAIYTDNYLFDLAGRDFSANAIAYHPRKGFKDPFDGMECIEGETITLKAIGEYPIKLWKENDLDENELTLKLEPPSSLKTNPENILNALIFLGNGNYKIDEVTAKAINENAPLLRNIEKEILFTKFTRLLLTRNISLVMRQFPKVFCDICPDLKAAHEFLPRENFGCDLWEHICRAVEFSPPQAASRYTALFHNAGNPDCYSDDGTGTEHYYGHQELGRIIASRFLNSVTSDRKLKDDVDFLIEYHDVEIKEDRIHLKRLMNDIEAEELKTIIKLRIADDMAKPTVHEGKVASYRRCLQVLDDIVKSGECCKMSQLAIKKTDLLSRHLATNEKQAARIIEMLYEAVLEQPRLNLAPILIDMVKKTIKK